MILAVSTNPRPRSIQFGRKYSVNPPCGGVFERSTSIMLYHKSNDKIRKINAVHSARPSACSANRF